MNKKSNNDELLDSLLEFNGIRTGIKLKDRKTLIVFTIAFILFLIGWFLSFRVSGDNTGVAFGLFLSTLCLWVGNVVPTIIPALIMVVASLLLNLIDLGQVQSALGSSSVYATMGLFIVSKGAESSNIAKRLAFYLCKKLGKNPSLILLSMLFATAIMSAFVSNIATIIMMSGIGTGVLKALGENPGKSRFGSALILTISAAASIGGASLINGCPGINGMCISMVETSTGIQVNYSEWARFGVTGAIVIAIPAWFIYMKCSGFKKEDLNSIDSEYFNLLYKELGPLSGSEIRWIATVAIMIITLLRGMPLPLAGLLFGTITMLPIVGTVNGKEAMRTMPFDVIIMCGLVPLYGTLFNNTGLSNLFGQYICRLIPLNSVLFIIMVPAVLMAILNNLFINATAGVAAICVGAVAPIMVEMGYNPAVCLLPTMMLCGYTIGFGAHIQMIITYETGYWEMNEVMKPGFILVTFIAVVFSVLLVIIAPTFGLRLYL